VRLSREIETPDFSLRIQGRIDGLLASAQEVLLEEIKTVQGGWDRAADPLHWAQAKLYGFIYALDNSLEQIDIQLTYLDLDTGELTEFRNLFTLTELSAFFEHTTAIYLDWLRAHFHWCRQRDESIRSLTFPFARYRPGQRPLAVAAYRVLARGGRLFLEAPTGIGKTISVLFPAVKALGEGKLERIFYLTARTVGRAVAEKACADLRQTGLRLRTLTLTAKDKICAGVRPSPGAAGFDPAVTLESADTPLLAVVAAPGDGRTPACSPRAVVPGSGAGAGVAGGLAGCGVLPWGWGVVGFITPLLYRSIAPLLRLHDWPPAFAGELLLELEQAFDERLGSRRAARDIDIHREQLIHPFNHRVLAREHERPAGDGAIAHRDDPFGLGHLVVERLDGLRHLLVDGAGDDHQIRLARRGPEDLGAKASQIKA
jgi:hypothetical protein